jgi:uncharacterized protein YjiS (DUF1127 family)
MLNTSPIADIYHLIETAPVNPGPIIQFHQARTLEVFPIHDDNSFEDRYSQAFRIASMRLTGSLSPNLPQCDYVAVLIHHHARSILLPLTLLVGASFQTRPIEENLAIFKVPLNVFEKRVNDADVTRFLRHRTKTLHQPPTSSNPTSYRRQRTGRGQEAIRKPRFPRLLAKRLSIIFRLLASRRETANFHAMDDHILKDMGLSRHHVSLLDSKGRQ